MLLAYCGVRVMVGTPGNKAAKKTRSIMPVGKRNAIAFEVSAIMPHSSDPGAYQFVNYNGEQVGIVHACPCGCGQLGTLYWKNPRVNGPNWTVSGKWPKVSFKPSIGFWGENDRSQGFHWHGYLTDGEFREI